jgi:hypothetical protein
MWCFRAILAAALLFGMAVSLGACGEQEISDIPAEQAIRAAIDPEGGGFAEIKGKTVRWQGQVTEARQTFEDDYMEVATLYVDLDGDGGAEGADVQFQISPDDREDFQPGQSVSFTATIREVAKDGDRPLLVMKLRAIE